MRFPTRARTESGTAAATLFAVTATAERGVGGRPEKADRGVGTALATDGFVDLDTPSDARAAGDDRALIAGTEGAARAASWPSSATVAAGENDALPAGTEDAGEMGDGKTGEGPDSTVRDNAGDAPAAVDRSDGGARATRVGCMSGLAMRDTADEDDGVESKYRGRKAGDTDRFTT